MNGPQPPNNDIAMEPWFVALEGIRFLSLTFVEVSGLLKIETSLLQEILVQGFEVRSLDPKSMCYGRRVTSTWLFLQKQRKHSPPYEDQTT